MARSDTTTSPTPFSPFSSYSAASEATSDGQSLLPSTSDLISIEPDLIPVFPDQPDLGAFTNVFRALNDFHQEPRTGIPIPIVQLDRNHLTPTSLAPSNTPDGSNSTVWSHGTTVSYLTASWQESRSFRSPTFRSRTRSLSEHLSDASDTEGEELLPHAVDIRPFNIDAAVDILQHEVGQPSLGYLGQALGFIAAERARFVASRDTGGPKGGGSRSSTSEYAWKHVIQPRRKRRRKKPIKSPSQGATVHRKLLATDNESRTDTGTVGEDGVIDDSSSSSLEISSSSPYYKSASVNSRNKEKRRRSSAPEGHPRLLHTRSTPTLRLPPPSIPFDPRVIHLRALAHKLRLLFPEDAARLASILSHDQPDDDDFVDPRGPNPQSEDTLVHVFVDHSNILIGFLSYLKRHPATLVGNPSKRLSHAALALILERGRSITRRVLVTSSPLYQSMESAEQLGYEVRVYARVPDMGDGMDRQPPSGTGSGGDSPRGGNGSNSKHKRHVSSTSIPKGHSAAKSLGVTSESDPGPSTSVIMAPNRSDASGNTPTTTAAAPTRIKYREQGVDELLQLKLHQAIADVDVPPLGATIVLATGDGNVGQFNEEGFLGCVRTALKKGWRVELYAWEGGMSKSWKREFGEGLYSDKFTIIGLNQFGPDLLEV